MNKLGLALGGGGARGAAHIGVLKEFERLGIYPDLITGTSIGGLVGGLMAAGMDAQAIKNFFLEINLGKLFALPNDGRSVVSNTRFAALLESRIGRPTFADLHLPLAVVATDMQSRREVVIDEGDVVTALLATTAFPVILPPIELEGHVLIDGGLINNLPFDVARARGATAVVAVALNNSTPYGSLIENSLTGDGNNLLERMLTRGKRQPLWQIVTAVSDIITTRNTVTRQAVSPPDVMLRPFIGDIGLFDFHALEAGIEAGRRAVEESEEELVSLTSKLTEQNKPKDKRED